MAELKRARLMICFCFLMLCTGLTAVANPEWLIRINIPACTLELLCHGEVWRRFPVAVGKRFTPTPVGNFMVRNIIKNPTWYPVGRPPVPPGAENPLGGYWLGLSIEGYGIHGNNNPASIGHPESNGCIRMHNQDVTLLVQMVSVGTPVEIIYRTVEIEATGDKMWLTLYPDLYRRQPKLEAEIKNSLAQGRLLYPVHWAALLGVIGAQRPVITELPQELSLVLDGEPYPHPGFLWGEKAFLPATLTGLWGVKTAGPYIELMEFMRSYAGQVYGEYDQQAKTINLHTLRIYFKGRLFPLRGWFQEEPYLPREFVAIIGEELQLPSKSELPPKAEGEGLWVPLAVIVQCWSCLKSHWDDEQWVLTIDY